MVFCITKKVGTATAGDRWLRKNKIFADADEQPDSFLIYKMIFNIENEKEKEGVDVRLWKIARTLNLLKAGKVAHNKIDIVGVIDGDATYAIFSYEEYNTQF